MSTNVARLFGQQKISGPSAVLTLPVAEDSSSGQRTRQLEDTLRRQRWWTANPYFRTDPPPTTPSPGHMSTARSRTAMGPSRPRPRRPTSTRSAKASSFVNVALFYGPFILPERKVLDEEERFHHWSLPASLKVSQSVTKYSLKTGVILSSLPSMRRLTTVCFCIYKIILFISSSRTMNDKYIVR